MTAYSGPVLALLVATTTPVAEGFALEQESVDVERDTAPLRPGVEAVRSEFAKRVLLKVYPRQFPGDPGGTRPDSSALFPATDPVSKTGSALLADLQAEAASLLEGVACSRTGSPFGDAVAADDHLESTQEDGWHVKCREFVVCLDTFGGERGQRPLSRLLHLTKENCPPEPARVVVASVPYRGDPCGGFMYLLGEGRFADCDGPARAPSIARSGQLSHPSWHSSH